MESLSESLSAASGASESLSHASESPSRASASLSGASESLFRPVRARLGFQEHVWGVDRETET